MKIAKMPDGSPEIYLAIQGEGRTIGKPTVFVRFSICNLHCKWCDTAYTWNFEKTPWEHEFSTKCNPVYEQIEMTTEEVVAKIREEAKDSVKAVTFTGGEPMVHQKQILEIIDELGKDWYFEIETNGTIEIPDYLNKKLDMVNCSPKLSSSGNDNESQRIVSKALESILKRPPSCYIFKFVVTENEQQDLAEIIQLVGRFKIPHTSVYLMPEGVDQETISLATKKLVSVCQDLGFNLSTRLQVLLFGTKRAV